MDRLLDVVDLNVGFRTEDGVVQAVRGVDLHVGAGEILAIVGESGSGKSVTAMSFLKLLPPSATVEGTVSWRGEDLLAADEKRMRQVRGDEIAMIFQDPLSALNPVYKVGDQIAEMVLAHQKVSRRQAKERAIEMLGLVGIPQPKRRAEQYPHEFSGGMRQRAMIAMGLTTAPELLIADEPTTALDVTTQAQILDLLRDLNQSLGMATLLITHNLGAVARLCERTIIMYGGKIVECGPTEQLFADPQHPYTRLLLQSVPRMTGQEGPLTPIAGSPPDLTNLPSGCTFHPRCPFALDECRTGQPPLKSVRGSLSACWVTQAGGDITPAANHAARHERASADAGDPVLQVRDLVTWYGGPGRFTRRKAEPVRAVDGVSLEVSRGETLAVVGESGCGKTTLAQTIMRLVDSRSGQIIIDGEDITALKGPALRRARRKMALIFQDPYSSLNPRHTVAEIIGEPLAVHGLASGSQRTERIVELLELVGLNPRFMRRYPHQFSGGQRQRVAVARALASDASLLICDEPTSALDVSIQAQILTLLERLQGQLQLTYLFISHDLAAVRYIANRIAVMYQGRIVESGPAAQLLSDPQHPYTRRLIDAVPVPDPRIERERRLSDGVPAATIGGGEQA